ncbi:MAG TPA: CdaR family protein [Candidatus Binatia bacterium]|nr:CdaR family protein [Candidatus Binatia bacterium]
MSWFDRTTTAAVWRRLEPLRARARWRAMFTQDLGMKLVSLAVAFGLWAFVNASERDTEQALQVALELRDIPIAMMITSPRVDFVDLRVSGPRTLLSRIDSKRLMIPLDLSGLHPGPAVFRITADSLNLPRGVKVARITPAQITIDLERIVRRTVPVRLQLAGKLPPGLHVVDTRVSPETIEVIGPASAIEDLKGPETEPLNLTGVGPGKIERELAVPPISEYVSFSAQRVAVKVQIDEIEIERELRHVPVVVRGTHHASLDPSNLRVVVRGPKHVVESLELSHGEVYIDAANAAPGRYQRTPTVELPPGVELLRLEPAELQMRVLKGRK